MKKHSWRSRSPFLVRVVFLPLEGEHAEELLVLPELLDLLLAAHHEVLEVDLLVLLVAGAEAEDAQEAVEVEVREVLVAALERALLVVELLVADRGLEQHLAVLAE